MIDKAEITVKAGNGGDGTVSFRREKFVPFGGPDGGDGGSGGSIIIRASAAVDDLRIYRQRRLFKAENGAAGGARKRHGRSGDDLILEVPTGTIVTSLDKNGGDTLLADLGKPGDEVAVAAGGHGGRANVHFTSSTNQAPYVAQRGEPGQEARLGLEMRLIADVGIIGYPNAGKSTLLAAASAAKPKIADYPFTTLEPVLGVVETADRRTFVLAEIPGLIEGAHEGRGLGHDFLRHAMRTRMFVHVIAGDAASPVDDMLQVNRELHEFDPELATRPQVIAVNKVDLASVRERLAEIKKVMRGAGVHAHYIAAAIGEGVPALMADVAEQLRGLQSAGEPVPAGVKVFRPLPRPDRYSLSRDEAGFVVNAPELERLYVAPGASAGELKRQITFQLQRMGAAKDLEKAGIRQGDAIRCGEVSWTW